MSDEPAMSQYKWPSKVLRYKITCPFQRMLVVKHEGQIDWSGQRIESAKALDRYLREVMLPSLKEWITQKHPKSHYCKTLHLERMLANPAQHINQARQIRQREGDEAARQFLLGHINQHKKEHFEGWWRYLMEENPLYQKHPAFQYLVLRPVLEGSTAKDTRAPLPVDAEALAHLFERIQKGRVAPGAKLLRLLSEITAFGAAAAADGQRPAFGTDCRWFVVKHGDANAAKRVAALCHGSGWCVASSSMAAFYLRSSDFHLLMERGRAMVALRLSGNQAVEVQGHANQDPGQWWPRTLLYCAARSTRITHREDAVRQQVEGIRTELAAAQKTAKQLGELLKAQPAKVHLVTMAEELDDASLVVVQEAWLACVRADPLCGGLLPDWMETDPAVKQATLEAWVALVSTDPLSYAGVPGTFSQVPEIQAALKTGWFELLERDVTLWNQCPEFLQQQFKQDVCFIQIFKTRWIELLNCDVIHWNKYPEFLLQDEEVVQVLKNVWVRILEKDPQKWRRCPELLQQNEPVIQVLRTGWERLLKNDATKWNQRPRFLTADPRITEANKRGWERLLKKAPHKWKRCPAFLRKEFQQDEGMVNKLVTYWIEWLAHSKHAWADCPNFLRENTQVFQACRNSWIQCLRSNPSEWYACPAILQDADMHRIVRGLWAARIENRPIEWSQCPDFLKNDFKRDASMIQGLRRGWINALIEAPHEWNQCPDFLQGEAEVRQALKNGWIKRIESDPTQLRNSPRSLWEDAKIIQAYKKGWIALHLSGSREWERCPEALKTDHEFVELQKRAWINKLGNMASQSRAVFIRRLLNDNILALDELPSCWLPESPASLATPVPLEMVRRSPWISDDRLGDMHVSRADDETQKNIMVVRLKYWESQVKKDWRNWSVIPPSLRDDEGLLRLMRKGLGPEIRRDPGLWYRLAECYRTDECLQRVHSYATRDRQRV